MRVLSIRQPWAWLIVNGIKTVENRSWETKYRGEFLVHSGLSMGLNRDEMAILRDKLKKEYEVDLPFKFPTGGIVGGVSLVDCTKKPMDLYDKNWHMRGSYGFILRDAFETEYIPMKGKLNLFEIPEMDLVRHPAKDYRQIFLDKKPAEDAEHHKKWFQKITRKLIGK